VMEPLPAVPTGEVVGDPPTDVVVALFEALYQAERDPMVRLALSIVDDPARAAEIVHDAFERLYLRWGRVREPGAYLRIAVVNGCRSELRRRAVLRRQPRPRHDEAAVSPLEHDDELLAALRALKPRQRIALTLRFYADLPDAEIADALGVRPGTVRSLISRGLAELREAIRKETRP
jgi:RNA polymerase sigma-70 factor (sigma-E family)